MTTLETRLRTLRHPAEPGPSPDDLRHRAARRARRRRLATAAAVVPVIALAAATFALVGPEQPDADVVAEAPSTTTTSVSEAGPTRTLGSISGVEVDVSPRTGLRDGQVVEVRVEGLDELPNAALLVCAGDVTADDAVQSCATGAVERPGSHTMPMQAAAEQEVSISRVIHITRESADGNESLPYDCATEEAGCVLAVGPYALPPRAVLVPLHFRDEPLPEATASIRPSTDLRPGQEVTLTAEGLRPNGTFDVMMCEAAVDGSCDGLAWPSATSDGDGSLTTTVPLHAAIYSHRGRVDCTATPCTIAVGDGGGRAVEVPVRFADGVEAPVPELRIDPPGPYVDRQLVTVHGTGFPPGIDIGTQLGQCPADKDTAVEERCGYDASGSVVVDADGSFTMTTRLSTSLPFTGPCTEGAGCVLAWVIPHGPIAARVPLEFAP